MSRPIVLSFVVPGEPVAKQRARVVTKVDPWNRRERTTRSYTPKKTASYESRVRVLCRMAANKIKWRASDADRFGVGIAIYRRHEGLGGDLDNYVKALKDGMNGVAYPDDRYVRSIFAELEQDADNPRVEVIVAIMQSGAE